MGVVSEKNRRIVELIKQSDLTNYKALQDLLDMAKNILAEDEDLEYCLKITKFIKESCPGLSVIRSEVRYNELYWKTLLFEAPYLLDSFILYMEKNRPAKERFYLPRRSVLKQVVDAIQDLADDMLDELFINMPSRVGKTTIVRFANVWWASRNSESSNLYSAYSDTITTAFYTGCLELITDPTYCYEEIFSQNKVIRTDSKLETIDLNRRKTYPTITCRSLYGTLNGACDCNGLLIYDDLLSGIEEALSPDRLNTVWGKFDNNLIKRAKENAKIIGMGTRWSVYDPQGRRMDLLINSPEFASRRYRVISIPALNENDESNFDFPYGVGYSTQHYHQVRASFERNDDMASWYAQCQQDPIEREGTLFQSGSMNYFEPKDLPDRQPDRIFMAVDVAYGGGDFVAAPICYQFESDYYIADVIFDDRDKYITRPMIRDAILRYGVQAVQFEATKANSDYKEWIEDELKDRGYRCNMTTKPAPGKTGKEIRIRDRAPEIREMFFLADGFRNKIYQKFIQNIFSFKLSGKNKHDDAPDSMAQLCDMKNYIPARVNILDRRKYGL